METPVIDKIIALIELERGEYDFPITRETRIEEDLDISGDDAVDLLLAFSKKFNVDVSEFKAAEYFMAEGGQLGSRLIAFLFGGKKYNSKKELTVGDLEEAVKLGKLR